MKQETKGESATIAHTIEAGPAAAPETMVVHVAEADLRPWDLESKLRVVKGRHPRLDGPAKVTGRARFTFDIKLPGMLWAKMVRSGVPAGEIVALDTSKAEALAGVEAVWTSEARRVRFAGQDIAAVAATSQELAEEAARLVEVSYAEQPAVGDLERAMDSYAPLVYAEGEVPGSVDVAVDGNVVGPRRPRRSPNRGDVEEGFQQADVTVAGTYRVPVHTHCPLETHGVVARWEGDQLTVWASTQGVSTVREGMAEALGIDRSNVTVIAEHMGGGFGSKLAASATGSAFAVVACKLARQAGAPVKLMLDRREEQLCTGNAPSAVMTTRLGAKRDGTLVAIKHRSHGSAGITGGAATGGPLTVHYQDCPHLAIEEYHVFTNAGPASPLRAPGHPQGTFALESAMDELAFALGMDPLELRRRNDSHPVRKHQYGPGAEAIGWSRRNAVPGDTSGPRKRGIGMAIGNWYVIARQGDVGAEVKIHRDGSVEYFSGAQDIGTGFRTAMAIVVAEELGLVPAAIKSNVGDSRWPFGPSSGGSNTTNSTAPAVRIAARKARQTLFEIAGARLECGPEDLDAADGRIFVAREPDRGLAFAQVAARMSGDEISTYGEKQRQFETYRQDIAGVQFADVEVDVDTGRIRVVRMVSVNDCGIPINTLTAESQIIGAMIQGVSWALYEERLLDRHWVTMVNPNLESYKILGPADMFEAIPLITEAANAGNNTSATGIGEPPIVPTLAAVANAVFNATGARVRRLPMTPDRVLAALERARRSG